MIVPSQDQSPDSEAELSSMGQSYRQAEEGPSGKN